MKPAKNVLGGAGVVVLNEIEIADKFAECLLVPGLEEKATGVAEDFRLQQVGIVDFGG
jgi:hypothetical protein